MKPNVLIDLLNATIEKTRMETVKEFLFKVESYLAYHDDNDTFTKEELLMTIVDVAKEEYGVEVE